MLKISRLNQNLANFVPKKSFYYRPVAPVFCNSTSTTASSSPPSSASLSCPSSPSYTETIKSIPISFINATRNSPSSTPFPTNIRSIDIKDLNTHSASTNTQQVHERSLSETDQTREYVLNRHLLEVEAELYDLSDKFFSERKRNLELETEIESLKTKHLKDISIIVENHKNVLEQKSFQVQQNLEKIEKYENQKLNFDEIHELLKQVQTIEFDLIKLRVDLMEVYENISTSATNSSNPLY